MKYDIRETEQETLLGFLRDQGEKPFRLKQINQWLWKKAVVDFDQMTDLSEQLRTLLKKHFIIQHAKEEIVRKSNDGTIKVVFSVGEGHLAEGVLIPSSDRVTACISSQTGCKLKCRFCATGAMKEAFDLSSGQIVDQVVLLNKKAIEEYGHGLSNIVLMGMGEPLLNYHHVVRAIRLLSSPDGQGYSPKRITLSTAGLVKQIRNLADEQLKINLAISLHAANNKLRSELMPVNKRNPLEELGDAVRYFYDQTGMRVTFEYLRLNDFNDKIEDARDLAAFCRIVPCKINLIRYNPVPGIPFEASIKDREWSFMNFLESRNMIVQVRRSRGGDIDAACGQLANRNK
ncbi:MAG: 23S rRNA (adenine(2503)-C(2))-methyltransferase RlmN [Bacteroidota bacterium]